MQTENLFPFIKLNKFKSNIPQKRLNEVTQIHNELCHVINDKVWKFQDEQTLKKGILLIQQMQQSDCYHIAAFYHKAHVNKLLTTINLPIFSKLVFLNLMECQITSMQPIEFINAPNLIMICLQKNRITTAKSMQKWYFPDLRLFNMSCNLNQQHQYSSRVLLNTINQTYLERLNEYLKSQSTNLKNAPPIYKISSIYNFNTKFMFPKTVNVNQDQLILNSLFIEDPRFYAKLQLHSNPIQHLQINQNQNTLKFDSKVKNHPYRLNNIQYKKQTKSTPQAQQNSTQKSFFQKQNQHLFKKNRKFQQQSQNQSETTVQQSKQLQNNAEIAQQITQFRYLDQQQKKKIQKFLCLHHFNQIRIYQARDSEIQTLPIENEDTELKRKKENFQRIKQSQVMKAIRRKFKIFPK